MEEVIALAIKSRKKLKITCFYKDGVSIELEVLPLVLGRYFFGYDFLFGKINEFFHNCYKFRPEQTQRV